MNVLTMVQEHKKSNCYKCEMQLQQDCIKCDINLNCWNLRGIPCIKASFYHVYFVLLLVFSALSRHKKRVKYKF